MSVIDARASGIKTIWNGREYRSRFEAEVAHFLDWWFISGPGARLIGSRVSAAATVTIEYEAESFRLSNGVNYCPDFKVTDVETGGRLYVEARGYRTSRGDEQLVTFARESGGAPLLIVMESWAEMRFKDIDYTYEHNDIPLFMTCPGCYKHSVAGFQWRPLDADDNANHEAEFYVMDRSGDKTASVFCGPNGCFRCGGVGFNPEVGAFLLKPLKGQIGIQRIALYIEANGDPDNSWKEPPAILDTPEQQESYNMLRERGIR